MSSTTARKRALLLLIFVAQASTFSPPFPTLEVVSNKPECRDVYDTCMSTFRECLTSTSLAESCEEYRGNVCEGMVRVRCDKLVEVAVEDEYSDSDGEEATSHYTSSTRRSLAPPRVGITTISSPTPPISTVYLVLPVPDSSTTPAISLKPRPRVSIGANSTTTTAPRGLRLGLQDSAGVKVDTGRVLGWVAVCIIGGATAGL